MTQIAFKRGSSFVAKVGYTPDPGDPETVHDMVITSQVRTPGGNHIATLTVVKAADGLSVTVTSPEGTGDWPYGPARWDVKFDYHGDVVFSPTVALYIEQEVTQ
jgi:hypothetical protein